MTNGAHCPSVAPLVSGAPRAAEPREAAAAVSAATPRVSPVEFAPVDGAAQLVRLPEPAEVDEPGRLREPAEADEPGQLPEPAEVDEPARLPGPARLGAAERAGLPADSAAVAASRVLARECRDLVFPAVSLHPV
ncbi:MAG TPA: hypothetical protein VK523_00795 [Steroidobacteraceae bacterium]|nr:hypothetical protein [Steroidobacteraceae bacterium]